MVQRHQPRCCSASANLKVGGRVFVQSRGGWPCCQSKSMDNLCRSSLIVVRELNVPIGRGFQEPSLWSIQSISHPENQDRMTVVLWKGGSGSSDDYNHPTLRLWPSMTGPWPRVKNWCRMPIQNHQHRFGHAQPPMHDLKEACAPL